VHIKLSSNLGSDACSDSYCDVDLGASLNVHCRAPSYLCAQDPRQRMGSETWILPNQALKRPFRTFVVLPLSLLSLLVSIILRSGLLVFVVIG
jgi:hypothetical protein